VTRRFRYRAATAGGQIREGVLQGGSRDMVLRELRGQQLTPVQVEPDLPVTRRPRLKAGRRGPAVSLWSRELATLLDAGLPLERALSVTAGHTDNPGLADVLREVRGDLRGGAAFSEALARHPRWFPPLVPALVEAGEATGSLETVMDQAAEHLEETADLRSQVRAALVYPVLMAGVASLGVLVLLVFVIPRFTAILEDVGGALPLTTRALAGGSALLLKGWWLWLGLAIAGALWVRSALARPGTRERWDARRLGVPGTGALERKYLTARLTGTLGLLLESGVPVVHALRIAARTLGNRAVRAGVERAASRVAEGGAVAPALEDTLPPMAVRMLAVGEEAGRLGELCVRVARTYDRDVRRSVRTLVGMIEPTLILVFGALVGFVAIAMLQAIYSINSGVF
jgi:general secretion pathway protein F